MTIDNRAERLRANTREVSCRGTIGFPLKKYGESVNGLPLEYLPPSSGECDVLVFSALHGQEPETTLLMSKALRLMQRPPERCAVICCANPDGLLAGTRCNANGVDLNRNFPAKNWGPEPYLDYWTRGEGKNVPLSTGTGAASEPETKALVSLIEELNPKIVLSLHGPLDCVDDPESSACGRWLAERSGMKLVTEIGYPTPGSFGSWAEERDLHVITYELPTASAWDMYAVHLPIFFEVLTLGIEAWSE